MKYTIIPLFLFLCFTSLFGQDWQRDVSDIYSFSSPRTADLNNDNVKDIVFGAGVEDENSETGVVAINGATSEVLWTAYSRNQIFGSPLFLDINNDNRPEVFIGGRSAEFKALNGEDGSVVWEFYSDQIPISPVDSGIYQFYTPQWIPDQDGDGLPDLLNANGGDPSILLPNEPRPAGKLMVISSATGALLASAEVPDGQETYMSPIIGDFFLDGDLDIIYGTGGEIQQGSLWRTTLKDLLNNDISNSIELISNETKGFIAPPCLADLNEDNVPDIISNSYNGQISAHDGLTNELIWQVSIEMGETNASPVIGHFNDDNIPDVFCNYGIGLAPTFLDFVQVMIDGATGNILWEENLGLAQFASPLSLDFDEDGTDEVILCINDATFGPINSFSHELLVIDFNDSEINTLTGPLPGANANVTPWIGNLDNDGMLDLVYTHNIDSTAFISDGGTRVQKISLNLNEDAFLSWGAYIGSNSDGLFENTRSNCPNDYDLDITVSEGSNCLATAAINSSGCPTPSDCDYLWNNGAMGSLASISGTGRSTVQVTHPDGCVRVAKVDIPALEIEIENLETASCFDANDGLVQIKYSGGIPPYFTDWNGNPAGGSTSATIYFQGNLSAGEYFFELTDAVGCTTQIPVNISSPPAFSFDLSSSPASALGETDGSVSISVDGGAAPYDLLLNGLNIENNTTVENLEAATYLLSVMDSLGCTVDTSIVVEFNTGLPEVSLSEHIKIYPNPFEHFFSIQSQSPKPFFAKIRIYSVESASQYQQDDVLLNDKEPFLIDLNHLNTGIFLLTITTEKQTMAYRLLKY